MHVAHLLRKYNPAEWAGTEAVIRALCRGLQREGVRNSVYAPEIPPSDVPDPIAAEGAAIERFEAFVPVWGISAEQRRQMISVGGNLLSFDLPRQLWTDRSLSVIHAHTLGRIGGIGLTVARQRGLPFVVTIHGGVYDLPDALRRSFDAARGRGWEWGKPFGLLFRARRVLYEADAILTCNPREAELMRQRHPDRRVVVQPHGVDAAAYAVDHREAAYAAYPQLRGRDVVLSVGRIDPVKNQVWSVEQLPTVLQRHPNVVFVFAGACTDEAYGARLERRIGELGLGERVLVTGKLPPADPRLVGLLQVARVSTLPSIAEPFGLVIIEAWAAGTPVIASRTSGALSLIEHDYTGWLFDLEHPESYHALIDRALTDAAARDRLSAAARARVVAEFDSQAIASDVHALYEELVEQKRCGTSSSVMMTPAR